MLHIFYMPHPTRTPRFRHLPGFTLVETMISLLAFVTIVLAAFTLSGFAYNTTYANAYKSVANQATQCLIEQIRGTQYGLLKQAVTSGGTLTLKYYDPFADNGVGNAKGALKPIEITLNNNAYTKIPGIYVNTTVNADGSTATAQAMTYDLRITARQDPQGDGLSFNLIYRFDVPGSSGNFRTIEAEQPAFVANIALQ